MTDSPPLNRRALLLSALFATLIVALSGGMSVYVLADRNITEALVLARVAVDIERYYPERVDWNQVQSAGINGILDELDRYSTYHEPQQYGRINEELSGSYVGIGITVTGHANGLEIVSVRETGPAAAAGMLSGDVILSVDSTSLVGRDADACIDLIRGPEGTSVRCRFHRLITGDTLEALVARRPIPLEHIPYVGLTHDSVIYVRLLDFDAGASRDLARTLDSLLVGEKLKAHGLILDLRGNPGGLFEEAYRTANLFLESGQFIVGTEGRSRWNDESHYSTGRDITDGLPMAVLVDGGSASSAEIAAGALRQLSRAVLIGDTTFGKGLVQGFTPMGDGSALRLTIARYYLPGGVYLNDIDSTLHEVGRGLVPDYQFHFEERDPFPLALEQCTCLKAFVAAHQDEILAATGGFGLDDSWVERFADFAAGYGFHYRSPVTMAAETFMAAAHAETADPALDASIARMLKDARADDLTQFARYGRYVKMRLKQIAYGRRFGAREAYARAIVPDRPDIQFAAHLLRGRG